MRDAERRRGSVKLKGQGGRGRVMKMPSCCWSFRNFIVNTGLLRPLIFITTGSVMSIVRLMSVVAAADLPISFCRNADRWTPYRLHRDRQRAAVRKAERVNNPGCILQQALLSLHRRVHTQRLLAGAKILKRAGRNARESLLLGLILSNPLFLKRSLGPIALVNIRHFGTDISCPRMRKFSGVVSVFAATEEEVWLLELSFNAAQCLKRFFDALGKRTLAEPGGLPTQLRLLECAAGEVERDRFKAEADMMDSIM
ncbi:hypothetical protein HBI56_003700 [Parastagonospora nodorum]|nr:hypothetical protein HBH73_003390 [Parastagonospora nodorum]KAH6551297.1 hypothetical protein HBI56_003700 [Parastagonospora nodorum]